MLCREIIAVCSEIHRKLINALWVEHRISECYSWSYINQVLGFKRLILAFMIQLFRKNALQIVSLK